MLSLLHEQSIQVTHESQPPAIAQPSSQEPSKPEEISHTEDSPIDYEFVMGRRQLASALFVATVALSVISALSYLAGKSAASARQSVDPVQVVHAAEPTSVPAPPPAPAPVVAKAPAPVTAPTPRIPPSISEPPLFANPQDGSTYIQIGSVVKGIAVLMVDGLRKNGLDAFAAPGQSTQTFRVLIGPLNDAKSHDQARKIVNNLDLTSFARKYPY